MNRVVVPKLLALERLVQNNALVQVIHWQLVLFWKEHLFPAGFRIQGVNIFTTLWLMDGGSLKKSKIIMGLGVVEWCILKKDISVQLLF